MHLTFLYSALAALFPVPLSAQQAWEVRLIPEGDDFETSREAVLLQGPRLVGHVSRAMLSYSTQRGAAGTGRTHATWPVREERLA